MPMNAWESAETRRALAYPGDGLLDIFLGLTLLDAWTILRDPPGAVSGGLVIILFPLLLVAKRAITVPRLPVSSTDPVPRPRRPGGTSLPAGATAVVVFLLGVAMFVAPSERGAFASHGWVLVALAGLGGVAAAGVHLRAWRFAAYAVLVALALGLMVQGHEELTPTLAALAGVMVVWGGVLLLRFLAVRPRPA